jgi:tripartite-type tricarboxylate transporter receptor subunit TctC
MNIERRQFLKFAAACMAISTAPSSAFAQAYPSRAITLIVPFGAGGPTDVIARLFADRMSASIGRPIVVENVTGAAGTIAVGRAARATPDGYTLSIGHWGTHVVNGAVYSLPYDLLDLEPIALLATNPYFIVTKNGVPATNLKELMAWLNSNRGSVTIGTAGPGSLPHVIGVDLQSKLNTSFQFIPYRGGDPQVIQDMISGNVDMAFLQAAVALPFVQSGAIRAYAVTANTRQSAAPSVPTVDEGGLPGFYISAWHGLWAPKGTRRDIIAKLNKAVVDTTADLGVQRRLAELGQDIPPADEQTPEVLRNLQKAEVEKWWPVIKAAGIKAE